LSLLTADDSAESTAFLMKPPVSSYFMASAFQSISSASCKRNGPSMGRNLSKHHVCRACAVVRVRVRVWCVQ
jgi:hypothetical protein